MIKNILQILLFISTGIYAQDIVTDRPDQTESAVVLSKNMWQIESGGILKTNRQEKKIMIPSNLIRYGLTQNFEIRFFSQLENTFTSNKYSLNNIEIGYKIQLLNNHQTTTKIALLSHLFVPIKTGVASAYSIGTITKILFSHKILSNISLGYNIGYTSISNESDEVTYSLSASFNLLSKIAFYIEPYGFINNQSEVNINGGLTYLLKSNVQIDLSFGTGINHDMQFISCGISWLIP